MVLGAHLAHLLHLGAGPKAESSAFPPAVLHNLLGRMRFLEPRQRNRVENVDLVFDVRTFHDPDCEVNRHIGAYPEIFEFLGSKLSKFSGELRSACLRITTPAAFHNLLGLRKTAGVVLRPRPPAWFATERLEHSDLTARGEMPESVVHYDLTCFWLRAVDAWSGLPLVLIQWPSDPS